MCRRVCDAGAKDIVIASKEILRELEHQKMVSNSTCRHGELEQLFDLDDSSNILLEKYTTEMRQRDTEIGEQESSNVRKRETSLLLIARRPGTSECENCIHPK